MTIEDLCAELAIDGTAVHLWNGRLFVAHRDKPPRVLTATGLERLVPQFQDLAHFSSEYRPTATQKG